MTSPSSVGFRNQGKSGKRMCSQEIECSYQLKRDEFYKTHQMMRSGWEKFLNIGKSAPMTFLLFETFSRT